MDVLSIVDTDMMSIPTEAYCFLLNTVAVAVALAGSVSNSNSNSNSRQKDDKIFLS